MGLVFLAFVVFYFDFRVFGGGVGLFEIFRWFFVIFFLLVLFCFLKGER